MFVGGHHDHFPGFDGAELGQGVDDDFPLVQPHDPGQLFQLMARLLGQMKV
jgi:hypothetical protein